MVLFVSCHCISHRNEAAIVVNRYSLRMKRSIAYHGRETATEITLWMRIVRHTKNFSFWSIGWMYKLHKMSKVVKVMDPLDIFVERAHSMHRPYRLCVKYSS